jgi:hypothetical protein
VLHLHAPGLLQAHVTQPRVTLEGPSVTLSSVTLRHPSSPFPPSLLWYAPQAAFRRISLDVFGHLLDLDHAFHLHRKTGQIMRILDRGTSSIQASRALTRPGP